MMRSTYDFIVLGAGTSGCYLVERLSRDKKCRVLLVDAGCVSKNPVFAMPAGFTQTLFDSNYNWCFKSQPESELDGRQIYCPRGKVFGGSSMINGMIHAIGQPEDYQLWANEGFLLANPQSIYSHFNELFPLDDEITKASYHPLQDVFLQACGESGLAHLAPFHEKQHQQGAGVYFHTTQNGRRNAVRKLLPLLKQRSNVTLLENTHIDKLVFENQKVKEIQVLKSARQQKSIKVSGQVVVSLGAIGTPAVLQRSGVGNPEQLAKLGVDSYLELPVGSGLQDHLLIKQTYRLEGIRTYNSDAKGVSLAKSLWDYSISRNGAMCAGASSAGAFVALNGEPLPDTQIFFAYGSARETSKALVADGFDAVTIGSFQMRPKSRGRVTITSKNPADSPSIEYNYLTDAEDWDLSLKGLQFQKDLMSRTPFQKYQPTACKDAQDADQFIRGFAETAHHPVGTCAFGNTGVLDGNLKVKGIANLNVADASIMPNIISGNTQAVCAVIGDLLAQHLISGRNDV